jgi:hypothetical protein
MNDKQRHERSRTRMVLIIIAVMAVLVVGFGVKKLLLG